MIPIIGAIIGMYTLTRYISFLTRSGDRAENLVVKVMSFFLFLGTIFFLIALFASGLTQ